MPRAPTWVDDRNAALLVDFYELTMLQAYVREGMTAEAVFSLFVRRLPESRNYLLVAGLDDVLHYLETVRFDEAALAYLSELPQFSPEFVEWLARFRFEGDVYAIPEGTPVFGQEPILEIVAPIPQAQLAETLVMNQIHVQTLAASKASRVVQAARGRSVIDFGLRRAQGADAGLKAARAFYIAGVTATSNVLAGLMYGIPVSGTMAHSYVQAHERELDAFRSFAPQYPGATLLVDTYDTLEGVRAVAAVARELGDAAPIGGVRLDSGDLAALAFGAREILDAAGLPHVQVFASGGLDEHAVAELVAQAAPIAGFGVGTDMMVSKDAPALDLAYKLTAYAGRGRTKLAPAKAILPGRKQVFRIEQDGRAIRDVIARDGERLDGRPLLRKVMARGQRLPEGREPLEELRRRAERELALLPEALLKLTPARPPYPVAVSDALAAYEQQVLAEVRARALGR